MKDFKFKTSFAIKLNPVVQKDKYLSLASLQEIRAFLPTGFNIENRDELLPFAANAFIANRMNANYDGVLTKEALVLADNFPLGLVDGEHNRKQILGVITNASFSEFGSDKPLTREEASKLNKPFNVVLAGVIWRAANPGAAEYIEDTNDPSSPNYQKLAASWELGFYDYCIVALPPESKNFEDGEVITDPAKIAELDKHMKCNGGSGVSPDGKILCRVPVGEVKAIGIGLTENPAADVTGVAVPKEKKETEEETKANLEPEKPQENQENLSQASKTSVTEENSTMKITDIKQITDDGLKTIKASEITDFIGEQLKQANETYLKEKNTTQEALTKAQADYNSLLAEHNTNKTALTELQKKVTELEAAAKAKELQEKFNTRMSHINEKWTVDDELSAILASNIRNLSDEDFEKYEKTLVVMLKGREKAKEVKASTTPPAAPATPPAAPPAAALDAAINNGTPATPPVPNTPSHEPTAKEKFATAFSEDNWIFETRRR